MPIHLIRHANAGRRRPGGTDRERPLDEVGRTQAVRIRDHLQHAGIDRIVSSPARRCLETVEPLARAIGLTAEIDEALWEGRGAARAMALLDRLVGTGHPVVLCSHGDVIPMMVDTLAARGVPLHGSGCAKGSIWRLDVVDGAITAATYTAAP